MDVGIVAQRGNARAAYLAEDIAERLRDEDVAVTFDSATAELLEADGTPPATFADYDLVVSIGGDGTFLFAARGADGTPVLGVNLGEVGFLNAVAPEDAVEAVLRQVRSYRAGDLQVREAPRIVAAGDGWESEPAVNEVVVHGPRRGRGGGLTVEVRVDGSLYSGGHADGVLVATPTGSTAYNLSERGPLVHSGVEGLIVNEMAATDGMPPLVVGADSEVVVTVSDADHALVVSDGRNRTRVTPPSEVTLSLAESPMRLAGPQSDFFEALGKLG